MDEVLSLSDLQDIVLPAVPPFWPPAQGFWILLFLLVVSAISFWRWRRMLYRKDAYRRAGLELLGQAHSVRDVSLVLKRVALAAWPRDRVASLYGSEWADFLNKSCAQCRFELDGWNKPDEPADRGLISTASEWISRHHVSAGKESRGG